MFYLGIDVAKAKIDCCLILENSANKKKTKTFSNTPKGFEQLQIWLNQHAATSTQTIILMEATSIYHELLAKYLFDEGYQVSVTNPARARYFAQSMSKLNKTDKVDSEVLARFAMTANLHFWQPLPKHIQLLNALLDRRAVLCEDLQREKNRLEKAESTFTMEPVLQSLHKSIEQLNKHIQGIDQQIDLLAQIPLNERIDSVYTDGAYDTKHCRQVILDRDAHALIPPRKNAKPWKDQKLRSLERNELLKTVKRLGRTLWKKWSGYHRRSLVETKMHCIKLLGDKLTARSFSSQVNEIHARIAVLNKFTELGRPHTQVVT